MATFAYAIHTVSTDNGMPFADLPKNRGRHTAAESIFGGYIFDRFCSKHGIQQRLSVPSQSQRVRWSWTVLYGGRCMGVAAH